MSYFSYYSKLEQALIQFSTLAGTAFLGYVIEKYQYD